jgi:hypothetical protein
VRSTRRCSTRRCLAVDIPCRKIMQEPKLSCYCSRYSLAWELL